MKTIIKTTHVFDNIQIVSKLRVVKISSKLGMAIIWVNVWDLQSSTSAKTIINKCFNVRSHIATI